MALKAVLASLDDVDEAQHGLYSERDGKFYLDVEGLDADSDDTHPAIAGLKSAYQKQMDARKDLEKRLKELEPLKDIDPEEYQRLKKEAQEAADKKLIDEGDVDKIVASRVEETVKKKDKAIDELQGQLNDTSSLLDRVVVSDRLKTAATAAGVKPKALETAVTIARNSGWKRDGDTVVLTDGEGNVRHGADGKPMTPEDWFGSDVVQEAHDYLFPASSGGGSQDEGGGKTPPASFKPSRASAKEKTEYRLKYGDDKFEEAVEREALETAGSST